MVTRNVIYPMTQEEQTMFRTYAWSYFSFHADQRMKTFNFFLIVAGLLASGIVSLIHESSPPWLVSPFGLALTVLCVLFWKLDERNRVLIENGEVALKYLDSLHNTSESGQPPNELRIFERDEFNHQGKSRSIFKMGHFSYSQVIRRVYFLFGCLGIFLASTPLLLTKPAPAPLSVHLQTVPELSIVSRHPSAAPASPAPRTP